MLYMDFYKSIDAEAVHMLKGKQGDILRLPGVMYFDCRTNLALQVRDLYNHVRIEIHLLAPIEVQSYSCVDRFTPGEVSKKQRGGLTITTYLYMCT